MISIIVIFFGSGFSTEKYKEINLVLESESNGSIDRKLLYVKDQSENFAIDLTDPQDVSDMILELKNYLKKWKNVFIVRLQQILVTRALKARLNIIAYHF